MKYLSFRNELKDFPVFTKYDFELLSSKTYYYQIVEWQKKGYLKRLANGLFCFDDLKINEQTLYYISNKIYSPSYISLETALSYYGFIPEAVFHITSVTTKKTTQFEYENTVFFYRTIKPNLYFGYTLLPWENVFYKFAKPEKAILDFFYLNSHLNSPEHIEDLRFNVDDFNQKIDRQKLFKYIELYDNKKLNERINTLLKWIDDNA